MSNGGRAADSNGKVVLHTEGEWELISTENNWASVAYQGWKCVIKHECALTSGSPYWMLIERYTDLTECLYCYMPMPDGIVALFKLLNSEIIK